MTWSDPEFVGRQCSTLDKSALGTLTLQGDFLSGGLGLVKMSIAVAMGASVPGRAA